MLGYQSMVTIATALLIIILMIIFIITIVMTMMIITIILMIIIMMMTIISPSHVFSVSGIHGLVGRLGLFWAGSMGSNFSEHSIEQWWLFVQSRTN